MTWQQQMPRKQQVIVLFLILTPPEVLLFLLHISHIRDIFTIIPWSFIFNQCHMIYSYAFSDNMEKGFGTSIFFAHINTTILNRYVYRNVACVF